MLTTGQRITATTANGTTRTGTYHGTKTDHHGITTAVVRFDGDNWDAHITPEHLTPAGPAHLNFRTGQRVNGITPTGRIVRTGEYHDRQLRACQTTRAGGEYEALVIWGGDTEPSLVSFENLAAA